MKYCGQVAGTSEINKWKSYSHFCSVNAVDSTDNLAFKCELNEAFGGLRFVGIAKSIEQA